MEFIIKNTNNNVQCIFKDEEICQKIYFTELKRKAYVIEEEILKEGAIFFNLSEEEIKSSSRDRKFLEPRYMIMYFIKTNTRLTLKEIGVIFGNRDHSTVINAIDKHNQFIFYPLYQKTFEKLKLLSLIHI
jgi:chromosomal replication initiation ATPase DnaA